MKEEINLAISRKESNFKIIIKQMEENLKDKIQEEIMKKTVEFTQLRIKNNISKNHDDKFIKESLKKNSETIIIELYGCTYNTL